MKVPDLLPGIILFQKCKDVKLYISSLWPCVGIWQHRSGSPLTLKQLGNFLQMLFYFLILFPISIIICMKLGQYNDYLVSTDQGIRSYGAEHAPMYFKLFMVLRNVCMLC